MSDSGRTSRHARPISPRRMSRVEDSKLYGIWAGGKYLCRTKKQPPRRMAVISKNDGSDFWRPISYLFEYQMDTRL